MTQVPQRTGSDRLRYSIGLEIGLLAILIPAGSVFFDKDLHEFGLFGLCLSLKAVVVSYLYNLALDHADKKRGRIATQRGTIGRILHAVGFEGSLLITSVPIYMYWLGLSLLEAIATDLVVTSFVVVYTYVFTLAYDKKFPLLAAS